MHLIPNSVGSADLHEYNTCHAPSGSSVGGQFCAGGGTVERGTPNGPAAGIGTSGHSHWAEVAYSFPIGGAWDAQHLGAVPVSDLLRGTLPSKPTFTAMSGKVRPYGWNDMGWLERREVAKRFLAQFKVPPGMTLVFRIGRAGSRLGNKNGGNLEAIIAHLDQRGELGLQHGDHLNVYAVRLLKTPVPYVHYEGTRAKRTP